MVQKSKNKKNAEYINIGGDGIVNSPGSSITKKYIIKENKLDKIFTMLPTDFKSEIIGRENEIDEILKKLVEKHLVVLRGMGGIGKTKIVKTIYNKEDLYDYRGYIYYTGNMRESVVNAFELHSGIQFEEDSDINKKYSEIERVLNNTKGKILLIADNVNKTIAEDNDISLLGKLKCDVLVTSRCKLFSDEVIFNLDFLSADECKEIFKKYYKNDYEEEILDEIIGLTGRHTMTVELIAKTAEAGNYKLKELLDKLHEQGFYLEDNLEEVSSEWNDEIVEERLSEHLIKLLSISSLSAEEIEELAKISLVALYPISKEDVKKLIDADSYNTINRLEQYGWLMLDESNIQVHSVVASIVEMQYKLDSEKYRLIIRKVAKKLKWEQQMSYFDVIPYLQIATYLFYRFKNIPISEVTRLGRNIALLHLENCEYSKTLEYLDMALNIRISVLGKEHEDIAEIYDDIAKAYIAQGKYDISLKYSKNALEIQIKELGLEHRDVVVTYILIADAYYLKGGISASEENYNKSLDYYKKAETVLQKLDDKDLQMIGALNNHMARVYIELTQYVEAMDCNEKSLKISIEIHGEMNTATAYNYNNGARLFDRMGKYDEAMDYNEKALNIRKSVLGNDHRDIAESYENIACVYRGKKEFKNAIEYFFKSLKIYEKILDINHPFILAINNNIAITYADMTDWDNAIIYFKKALGITRILVGEIHQKTGDIYTNIAETYAKKGDIEKALEYLVKASYLYNEKGSEIYPNPFPSLMNLFYKSNIKIDFKEWLDKEIENYKRSLFIK